MKKVLVVFPPLTNKQILPWFTNQIEAIKKAGYQTTVINLPQSRHFLKKLLLLLIKITLLPWQIFNTNIVYLSPSPLLAMTIFIAKLFNKKVIIGHHLTVVYQSDRLPLSFLFRWFNFFDRFAYHSADLIITDSLSYTKTISREMKLERCKCIECYSPVDINLFSPQKKYRRFAAELKEKLAIKDKDILFYHGYSHPWHGLGYFFKAMPKLYQKNPDFAFIFLILSKKEARKFFPKEIINFPNTFFLPKVSYEKLPYYLALADLWIGRFAIERNIMPSISTAAIEAMACAKPIIVYDSPEYRRFIKDGQNGILVKGENVVEIEDKIISYFKDKKRLIKMGRLARQTAEKYFSIESFAAKLKQKFPPQPDHQ